ATRTCEPSARGAMRSPVFVIAGLDPAIHLLRKNFLRRMMDPRIKSGGDESSAESVGCACRLFSSSYLLLFGGSEAPETGARWSPFSLLFRYVTGKSTSARLHPASCFLLLFTGTRVPRAQHEGASACDISAFFGSR